MEVQAMQLIKQLSYRLTHAPQFSSQHKEGFLRAQRLAEAGALEVAKFLQPGWTEKRASSLYETYLRDNGVRFFFHQPFAWFGARTRFEGFRKYRDFMPTTNPLKENDVFILDAAPILEGYIADIGYTGSLEPNPSLMAAKTLLSQLRVEIPSLVEELRQGSLLWQKIDQRIHDRGYDNIHKMYPFSVLGHRVHHEVSENVGLKIYGFGWQSFWEILSRGLFGQLLTQDHQGEFSGLWAIEPHIGGKGFGAKFEEILVIEKGKIAWLEESRNGLAG